MATKKKTDGIIPIEQQLAEIRHIVKILAKGQEQIKSHLWRDKPVEAPTKERSKEIAKYEAIDYINNIVMPEIEAHQAEQGEIGAQGLWDFAAAQIAQPLVN
jgi:hypothetical protein